MPSLYRIPTLSALLRSPEVIVSIALAAVVGILWWLASETHRQADASRAAIERTLRRARLEQVRLAADTEHIRRSALRVGELLVRGRLDSVRQQSLTARLGDFGRHYHLPQARSEFSPATEISAGPYLLQHGTMRLHADLLHGGDLLALLRTLSETTGPNTVPRRCRIERIRDADPGATGPDMGLQPLLKVDCTFDWFSISERDDDR